jgi:5'(3')-deoxyribonucleotidase
MNKQNLFLDFDDTIVNSTKAICQCYNHLYSFHADFKEADWAKNKSWDFADTCPLMESDVKKELFRSKMFWEALDFMEDAHGTLFELKDKYNIIIVSLGTLGNLKYKAEWLKVRLPFIDNVILLKNSGTIMDKSFVNMDGGIFIDDVFSNLKSTNASVKYIFGAEKNYNTGSIYPRLLNWMQIGGELL